jgi:hypothetical protein
LAEVTIFGTCAPAVLAKSGALAAAVFASSVVFVVTVLVAFCTAGWSATWRPYFTSCS